MAEPVSVTTHIAAAPEVVYDLVSDLPRMGEWSPENTGGRWVGGATGPAVGARFRGSNRKGWRRWSTTVTVADATPGRAFAFDVTAGPFAVARWSYAIEPAGDGCDVTESWEDHRHPAIARIVGPMTGVSDRRSHNEATMRTTLERLKAAAEAGG
ncbi:MAG TPA: SRPBCC family protein [Acidimicrobiales bacterium]|nr:SRPBCC family protein [Acidimicrobiales bacterium]